MVWLNEYMYTIHRNLPILKLHVSLINETENALCDYNRFLKK